MTTNYMIETFTKNNFTNLSKKAFEALNKYHNLVKRPSLEYEGFRRKWKEFYEKDITIEFLIRDLTYAYDLDTEELNKALFLIENYPEEKYKDDLYFLFM